MDSAADLFRSNGNYMNWEKASIQVTHLSVWSMQKSVENCIIKPSNLCAGLNSKEIILGSLLARPLSMLRESMIKLQVHQVYNSAINLVDTYFDLQFLDKGHFLAVHLRSPYFSTPDKAHHQRLGTTSKEQDTVVRASLQDCEGLLQVCFSSQILSPLRFCSSSNALPALENWLHFLEQL